MSTLISNAEELMLLFVYGSLKRGQKLHSHLQNQHFVAEAVTQPFYQLFDCGAWPALVHCDPYGHSVHGELYQITSETLQIIDLVEGVDEGLYARKHIKLCQPFEALAVFSYFFLHATTSLKACGSRWP